MANYRFTVEAREARAPYKQHTVHVIVELDEMGIAKALASKAMHNKSRTAKEIGGLVKVTFDGEAA